MDDDQVPKKQRKGKTKGKGQKGKGQANSTTSEGEGRVFIPQEGQMLAVIIRILGGNHLEGMCADGKRRTIRIPGKIRRRVWVRTNDLVVIEPWHDLTAQNRADLIYRYRPTEIIRLARKQRWLKELEALGVEIPKVQSVEGF